ncbi:MAG: tetratricopeptide repeat protein [Candidatus Aminicenantes bacterium]|nr:tetratricopeptide repeat protein [Candidatus Aminicenantes bacterium]
MESKCEYRYPGSRPFEDTDLDRVLFFGREREKDELLQKIIARKLVVLHSVSGLGKTSLLNAGVSGLLRDRGFLPIKVRFNTAETSPVQTVLSGIEETVMQHHLDIEAGETDTLWHYFKTAAFWSPGDSLLTPVLILDQFEEFFAFHELEARSEFITQLADLINNTIPQALRQAIRAGEPYRYGEDPPRVRIVISIRSDFVGQLDELSAAIPDILENRYRLLALTRRQAREAIIRPAQLEDENIVTQRFRYSADALDMMLDYLSKGRERGGVVNKDEVESFQLQLLCRQIEGKIHERTAKEVGNIIVEKAELAGEPGMQRVLRRFYDDLVEQLDSTAEKENVRKLCEDGLISITDIRLSLEEDEIIRKFNISRKLLKELVNRRLLRAEFRVGSVYYELSHDTLITPIRLSQRKRRATIEKYALLRLVPLFIALIIFLALVYFARQNKMDTLSKESARVYNNTGVAQFDKGEYNAAIASYRKALTFIPDYVEAFNNMGNAQYNKGDYNAAITSYRKALEIRPTYISAKTNLTESYLITERFDNAMELAQKVLKEKDISQDQILAMKSIVVSSLFFQGNQAQALKELQKLIMVYRGLSAEHKRDWNYSPTKKFITQTQSLNQPTRSLLLKMIELLEAPKKEGDKILVELETMAREYER